MQKDKVPVLVRRMIEEHGVDLQGQSIEEAWSEFVESVSAYTWKETEALMSMKDVARTLGKSVRWLEDEIREGRLRPVWVGGTRRFSPASVYAYVERCAEEGR